MGKKPSTRANSLKAIKHETKQLNNLVKNLRPKVYITDSSKFKNLVQQLTGNENSPISSPPPSIPMYQDHAYQENGFNSSRDSSCFSTPLEGSPDLNNYALGNSFGGQQMEFSWSDLESLLAEMGSGSGSDEYHDVNQHGMIGQQEVCVYNDYDLSSFI